ncbi:Gfo/Idh/MocA family oxidoreductase [Bosea sp. (in: a-proteobacteria)]|jgi:predicted dehydrogenase|uniref:Gfo/Idh/MocA family protein n=1 Tax=Bosea sp. (in: a-proteobacteria) TaxID=1871050 RepID=UPI001ACDB745|nr:Gfo/Idh/MocA family oxidoreductase [Bosea sp. (in: a-proteobacteria)]MBN9439719.1 Gfo/Idh/MocA family oxidoreductase [Bosea sp. (in: a-proteobacteria)]
MTRKIGIAVIGLGPAALPHSRSLLDLAERVDVRHVVSRSQQRLDAYRQQFPFPGTTEIEAALADPAVEAVLVLTPPSSHLAVSERCLAAGKHVLVEKPLELTAARGRELVAAARQAGKVLGVVLQHRFRPASQRLKAALDAGELGEVEAALLQVPWWRPQSYYDEPGRGTLARDGGGVLLTQAIHSLDLFRSLVGVSRVVAAQIRTTGLHRMETEDYVGALLETANGAPATLVTTTAAYPGHPERIEIIGRQGHAALVGGRLELSFLDGRRETVEAEGSTGSGANIMDFPHDAHRAVIADFLDAIESEGEPVVTGEEALASQRLIDAILLAGRR